MPPSRICTGSFLVLIGFVTLMGPYGAEARASWITSFNQADLVASQTSDQVKGTRVAIDGNGTWQVAFMDRQGDELTGMDRIWYRHEGSSPELLYSGSDLGNYVDIAIAPNGTRHVVFIESAGGQRILQSMSKPEAGAWSGPVALQSGLFLATAPRMDFTSDGTWHVVFTDRPLENGLQPVTRWLAQAGTVTTIASEGDKASDIAVGPNDEIFVVYSHLDTVLDESRMVLLQKPLGGNWTSGMEILRIHEVSLDLLNPSLAIDDAGDWHITYSGMAEGTSGSAVVRYLNETAGPEMVAGEEELAGYYGGVALSGDGILHVAYSDVEDIPTSSKRLPTRSVRHRKKCIRVDQRLERRAYYRRFAPCGLTPGSRFTFPDNQGNRFVLSCEVPGAFGIYCLQYVKAGSGPEADRTYSVGYCPWCGASNRIKMLAIPQPTEANQNVSWGAPIPRTTIEVAGSIATTTRPRVRTTTRTGSSTISMPVLVRWSRPTSSPPMENPTPQTTRGYSTSSIWIPMEDATLQVGLR